MDVLEIGLLLIQIAALIHLSNIIYNYCLFAEDNKIFSCIEIQLPNRTKKRIFDTLPSVRGCRPCDKMLWSG